MRRILISAALAAAPLLASATSVDNAAYTVASTQDLVNLCSTKQGDALYPDANMFCIGYIAGAAHYHRELTKGPLIKPIICPPEGVTRSEAVAIFLDWAKRNPGSMALPAVEGLLRAGVEKFPCPSAQPAKTKGKAKAK